MLFTYIIKTIKSPKSLFEEEIPGIAVILYLIMSGALLYLFAISFIKYGLNENILSVIPEIDINSIKEALQSPYLIYISITYPFVSLFFITSIYEMLSQLLFKKGNGIKLLKNLAFASLPLTISRFLYTLLTLLKVRYPFAINIVFYVWEVVLFIFAIEKTYEIDTGRASLIYFSPFIFILLMLIPAII